MNTFSLSVYCVEEELIRAAVGVRLFLKALLPRLTSLRKLSIVSRQDMLLVIHTGNISVWVVVHAIGFHIRVLL